MVLEDGIISPSEDQLLWAMREQLNIDEAYHIQMVMTSAVKTPQGMHLVRGLWLNFIPSTLHGIATLAKRGVEDEMVSLSILL